MSLSAGSLLGAVFFLTRHFATYSKLNSFQSGFGKPLVRLIPETAKVDAVGLQFYAEEGVLFAYEGGAVGDLDGKWTPMGIDEAVAYAKRLSK
jgi:hypothetical protein